MVNTTNPHYITQNATGTSLTQPVDTVDFPHSGLIKALNQMAAGNVVVKTGTDFDINQTGGNLVVAAGKILRNGKYHEVATKNFADSSLTTTYAKGYHLLVVADGREGGETVNVLYMRPPTATNRVPEFKLGDTIVALVEYSSGTSSGSRLIQYFTTNKESNSLSIAYANSNVYTQAMTVDADADGDVTFENVVQDKDIIFKVDDGGTPTEVMRIDGSTSRVGIGTNAPSHTLEISAAADTGMKLSRADGGQVEFLIESANGDNRITFSDGGTDKWSIGKDNTDSSFRVSQNGLLGADDAIVIDSSRNVGIGTNSPDANLHIVGAGSGDHLILEGTLGSAATSAPNFVLFRNGDDAAADIDNGDLIGQIVFRGENDASTPQEINYATIEGGMDDTTDGSEDGHLTFNLIEAGTLTEFMRLRSSTRDVVVNDISDDIDFRVEGNTDANLLFTDASADMVGIGLSNPAAKLHVKGSTTGYNAIFETDEDGASAAPDVALYRNSATPVNGDDLGHLIWRGVTTDDASFTTLTRRNYADIFVEAQEVTTDAESGKLHIRTQKGGTMNKRLSFSANDTIFNEDSVDVDFRVEGNGNTHALFVNGNNDKVGIGTNAPAATLDILSGGTFRNTRLLTVSVSSGVTLTEAAHAGRYNICAGNITLPSTSTAGEHYAILNTTGGNITIGRNGNNINGAGSDITLATYKAATCIAIGSNNWMVVG